MKKLKVEPGVCGLVSVITADGGGDTAVTISVDTQCPKVRNMIDALEQPVEGYEVCFEKPGSGAVYEAAEHLAHASCPIPSAVLKCIEAECSLALPKSVSFEFVE